MRRNASFWRNAAIVGLLHLAVVIGVVKWSGHKKTPLATSVVWLEESANLPSAVSSAVAAPLPAAVEPTPEPSVAEAIVPEEKAEPSPAKTELPLPTPSAKPTAEPTAKPTPRKKHPPKESPTPRPKKKTTKREKVSAKPTPAKKHPVEKPTKATTPAAGKKSGAAKVSGTPGGHRGAVGDKKFAWYGNMLHDRFFSAWDQPTSVVVTGAKMSVLVRLRIESDGKVSKFELVRPSGNVVVDDSVAAVAKRVARVDPLPAGLDGPYDVQISFELNPQ